MTGYVGTSLFLFIGQLLGMPFSMPVSYTHLLAEYKYYDMDKVIESAMNAAAKEFGDA